jgi:hypothetical protein
VNIFTADYKGTCALCYGTVRPGHKVVAKEMEALGTKYVRNVHLSCQEDLVESSPPDLAEAERNNVL